MVTKIDLREHDSPVVEVTDPSGKVHKIPVYETIRKLESLMDLAAESETGIPLKPGMTLDRIKQALNLPHVSDHHAVKVVGALVEVVGSDFEAKKPLPQPQN